MKVFTHQIQYESHPNDIRETLQLTLDERIKKRIKITLNDGEEALISLPRDLIIKENDYLSTEQGFIVKIQFAAETLSQVTCHDHYLLARLCYHLGNRHVPVEIQPSTLYYQHDHVLDDMINQLGGVVTTVEKAFYPEHGAYGGGKYFSHDGHSH